MMKTPFFLGLICSLLTTFSLVEPIYAITDPTATANNKFGIHIISATQDEAQEAADLVNSSGGDWGYVTVLIESNDRNVSKWQEFFKQLSKRHLIPIVRIASSPVDGGYWKKPSDSDAQDWANFLDQLNWPIKNRYVTIYNEPNHATEWGNTVDAASYAHILDQTISALKAKSDDFFVLNAGIDASAPEKMPAYEDEVQFLQDMNQAVPGIFNKLDGWDSHSYPNPGFVGSPDDTGRGTIRTYQWELQILQSLGVTKNLPVFITETGWKHDAGVTTDPSLPSLDTVASYYKKSFESVWNDNRVVAVTPFLLDYQQAPFDHFSFRKFENQSQPKNDLNILGTSFPDFYPQYEVLATMSKTAGKPVQENRAKLIDGQFYPSIAFGQMYKIPIKVKNTGSKTWTHAVSLMLKNPLDGLKVTPAVIPDGKTVEPGDEYTFVVEVEAQKLGSYPMVFNLFDGNQEFLSTPFLFTTQVKSPVHLVIQTNLLWKKSAEGHYLLTVTNKSTHEQQEILVSDIGQSTDLTIPSLLPDAEYTFTLTKPYYQDKSIDRIVLSGTNVIDFGDLSPNLASALFNPRMLWLLLPLSN